MDPRLLLCLLLVGCATAPSPDPQVEPRGDPEPGVSPGDDLANLEGHALVLACFALF